MSEVTIYTKEGCPYCAAAKKHYGELGVTINEIDIHNTPGAKEKAVELSGGKEMVPIIVDGDQVKVGFGGG